MSRCKFILTEDNQWYMQLDSLNQIEDYFQSREQGDISRAMSSMMKCDKLGHQTDKIANMANISASMNGTSFVSELSNLLNKRKLAMIKVFNGYGKACVNIVGGFNGTGFGSDTIIKTVHSDNFIFPSYTKKDIRVKRWDGGTHYYAYIGEIQVAGKDVVKWDTYKEAFDMATRYIASK